MCTKCAVRTPVGYRCKECVKGQQKVYFNARPTDIAVQVAVSVVLSGMISFVAMLILGRIGFFSWWLSFIIGPIVGGFVADIAYRAVGKRRSRYGWIAVAAGVGLGALPSLIVANPISWLIFAGFAVGTAVGRLRLGR